jgi:3-oxoacyl-[acyl-carrier-protein] synthase III
MKSVITGVGSYIPTIIKTNKEFTANKFYGEDNIAITIDPTIVVEKFEAITGIEERRYAPNEMNASDLGTFASKLAIEKSGVDIETIDQIIVAQNFGNVLNNTIQSDMVPSIASRIKHNLGIKNPNCIAYDIMFGCPGWIQGLIQSHAYFMAGMAKKCLVIGTETLSRVIDDYDRDSMIFSDGAGACIIECIEDKNCESGIMSISVQSHCVDEVNYIFMGKSNLPDSDPNIRYLKMKGRKVFEYAMRYVPAAMKDCLDKANVAITDVKKVFIHQANEKMDEGIIKAFYKLYDIKELPPFIMPMNIHKFGNSSVATVPTLFDLVKSGRIENHEIHKGDIILFASVGAGMNINAICYRV